MASVTSCFIFHATKSDNGQTGTCCHSRRFFPPRWTAWRHNHFSTWRRKSWEDRSLLIQSPTNKLSGQNKDKNGVWRSRIIVSSWPGKYVAAIGGRRRNLLNRLRSSFILIPWLSIQPWRGHDSSFVPVNRGTWIPSRRCLTRAATWTALMTTRTHLYRWRLPMGTKVLSACWSWGVQDWTNATCSAGHPSCRWLNLSSFSLPPPSLPPHFACSPGILAWLWWNTGEV